MKNAGRVPYFSVREQYRNLCVCAFAGTKQLYVMCIFVLEIFADTSIIYNYPGIRLVGLIFSCSFAFTACTPPPPHPFNPLPPLRMLLVHPGNVGHAWE